MARLLALAALLAAAPAWAALPVAYDADYKILKKGVAIGDPLTFELYELADCTGTPSFEEMLAPAVVQVGSDAFSAAQLRDALLAA